jgi:TRAP-type mannitol/chloroaromatic compound transport system permease small subunit
MGGSVLSFLKAEWKVSDTGSEPLVLIQFEVKTDIIVMFQLIWPSGFRGGDLNKLANQKQDGS